MSKVVRCPSIFCDGIGMPVDTKKKFSLGKAFTGSLIGAAVGGPIGSAIGGTMNGIKGKNGKTKFVCCKCGKVFEKKI